MPTYSSNADQVLKSIALNITDATNADVISRIVAEQIQGDIEYRVFSENLATDGGLIGTYSTNPMYASLKETAAKVRSIAPGRGKNSSKGTFKNGKPRKSKYYKGGYKEFKRDVKGTDRVNLILSGALQKSIRWTAGKKGAIIAFDEYGSKIGRAQEKHFNKIIFNATKEEINEAVRLAQIHVNKNLKK